MSFFILPTSTFVKSVHYGDFFFVKLLRAIVTWEEMVISSLVRNFFSQKKMKRYRNLSLIGANVDSYRNIILILMSPKVMTYAKYCILTKK